MSNKMNPRRTGEKRTETGPRWESGNPGKGINSTKVARARRKWKTLTRRQDRRQGAELLAGGLVPEGKKE